MSRVARRLVVVATSVTLSQFAGTLSGCSAFEPEDVEDSAGAVRTGADDDADTWDKIVETAEVKDEASLTDPPSIDYLADTSESISAEMLAKASQPSAYIAARRDKPKKFAAASVLAVEFPRFRRHRRYGAMPCCLNFNSNSMGLT